MSGPTLVLLAAGLGSRYGGLKQLDRLGPGGSTLMDYSLHDAHRAGFARAVFVIRDDMQRAFEEELRPRYRARLEAEAVVQRLTDLPEGYHLPADRARPWGTTQAVLAAAGRLTGPFAVLNADDCYGPSAMGTLGSFLRGSAPGRDRHAVVGYRLDQTLSPTGSVNRALLEADGSGHLTHVVEATGISEQGGVLRGRAGAEDREIPPTALVSMNLWGFSPAILPLLEGAFRRFLDTGPGPGDECYLPNAVQEAIGAGTAEVAVLPTDSQWCGVTHPGDRAWVQARLARWVAEGLYPERPWE